MSILPNIVVLLSVASGLGQTTQPVTMTRKEALESSLSKFDAATALKATKPDEARAMYRDALAGFEALIANGVNNGRLYFDIANTHMALDQLGPAIANYRKAQRLLPADSAIQHNLDTARKLVQVSFKRPTANAIVETLFFWHYSTSAASRLRIAMIAYAVFWILMLAMVKPSRRSTGFVWTSIVSAVIAIAAGSSVAYQHLTERNSPEGVVNVAEAVLRKGNGDYYDPSLVKPLPEGVELHVHGQRNDVQGALWYQVELPDGRDGWLRADQVQMLNGSQV